MNQYLFQLIENSGLDAHRKGNLKARYLAAYTLYRQIGSVDEYERMERVEESIRKELGQTAGMFSA